MVYSTKTGILHYKILMLLAMVVLITWQGCVPSAPRTYTSPNGEYVLIARVVHDANANNYTHIIIDVSNSSGKLLYTDDSGASDAMRWNIGWIDQHTIKLNSSDIGTIFWVRQVDGRWKRS